MHKVDILWVELDADSNQDSGTYVAYLPRGVLVRTKSWDKEGVVTAEALTFIPQEFLAKCRRKTRSLES